MFRFLLFSFSMLLMANLQADIHYIDLGDGLVVPLNANKEMDINNDGIVDFYVNAYENELGFTPIPFVGCFTSPSGSAMNNLDSRELEIHEEGDVIMIDNDNLFDYIDLTRGSVFNPAIGLADGWTDMEEQIIGFAVFIGGASTAMNGWMKVVVDVANETLIIKSLAYEDPAVPGEGAIAAGDTGETNAVSSIDDLNKVNIAPNPATDYAQLSFDYSGTENLQIIVQNNIGQEVYHKISTSKGANSVNIFTANWAQGIYVVRLESLKGIESYRLSVVR